MGPILIPSPEKPRSRWVDLLRIPQTWGVIIARSFTDPVWFFIADWFPIYLVAKGFPLKSGLIAIWIPFIAADLGNFFGGASSGYLIKRGWTLGAARKSLVVFGGGWSDFADTDGSYRQACADHCSFCSGDILLCRVLDDCQRVAFRPVPQRFGGVGQWTERHERGHWAIIAFKLVGYFSDAKQSLATHSFDTIIIVAGLVPFIGMILVLFLVRKHAGNETGAGAADIAEHEAAVVHRSL